MSVSPPATQTRIFVPITRFLPPRGNNQRSAGFGLPSPDTGGVAKGIIMNKLAKAAIAGSVGVALLLGGAGTLATWNAGTALTGGSIVSGNLTVGTAAAAAWTVQHLNAGSSTVYGAPVSTTLATYKASPGDKLTYLTTMPITVSGTMLKVTSSLASGSVTPVSTAPVLAADTAMVSALLNNVVTTLSLPATGEITGSAPAYTITPGAAPFSTVATVTATLTFPLSSVVGAENAYMAGAVNLAGMAVTLTQTN